jgi:two-component system NtrC family sensor kinase
VGIQASEYAKLLIDNVSALVVGLDSEGCITFFNRGAQEITGYRAEEVLGRDWFALLVPREDYPSVWRSFQRATGSGLLTEYDESPVRTADGSERIIHWHTIPLVGDGRMIGTLSFGLDVTERRAAEQRARAWEAQFRRFIDAAPEPIGVAREGRFLYANASLARALDYPDGATLVGREVKSVIHPDDHLLYDQRYRALRDGEGVLPSATYRLLRRDGAVLTFEWTSIPIELDGKFAQLAIGRDVTEARRMQAQLAESERMAALGVLTAGIAHELNNPLTYMALNLDLLTRLVAEARRDPARLDDIAARLGEVREAAERLSGIVRDLRSFSRSEEGRSEVDLGAVAQLALKLVHNQLRHRARLDVDIRPAPPVHADEGRLVQVVLNLVTNALQALPETPDGDNWVRVRVGEEEGGAVLTVADSGPGVPAALAGRVFEPFFTTKPVGQGTGLGLSIAHGIVRAFGGTIRLDSAPGEGARFRVWLPAARGELAGEPDRASDRGAAGIQPLRVLVVDDEPLIGAALRDALSPPHAVEVVTRGEDGLQAALTGGFDLVLCDVMMPGMSGIDVYQRAVERAPQLAERFVFMTGGAFTRHASQFLAASGRAQIAKPFDLDDLDQLLRERGLAGSGAR